MEFEVSVNINKPVEVVVQALLKAENHPYWTQYLEKFEVIKGKAGEAGSIGHLHYKQNGRKYIMVDKMIYSEPGKKYVSEVSGDVLIATVETNLKAIGDKTEMSVKWSGQGKILFLKILMPFMRGKMVRQSRAELELFKKLVERRGADFSKS